VPDLFQIRPEFRKYLLLVDPYAAASHEIQSFVVTLLKAQKACELHLVDEASLNDPATIARDLALILSRQKMGTYLYIAGLAKTVEPIKQAVAAAGFTESEMNVVTFGQAGKRIFCAGCQRIFEIAAESHETRCSCGLRLTITTHYSPRLDAYLGYQEINQACKGESS
jgi:hypothetical protein